MIWPLMYYTIMCYACIYSKSLLLKQLFAEWDGANPLLPLKYFYRYLVSALYYFFLKVILFLWGGSVHNVSRIDFSIHMSRTLFFIEDRINIVTCFLLIYHSLLMFLYCRNYVCYLWVWNSAEHSMISNYYYYICA